MEVSKRLQNIIDAGIITKIDLAEKIGIARVTLDTRLKIGNWKKSEKLLIEKIV